MSGDLTSEATDPEFSGLREAFEQCQARHGDRHAALHDVLEALGETIWRAQRDKAPLDALAYVEAVRRKASS